jgi:hypothetical protein
MGMPETKRIMPLEIILSKVNSWCRVTLKYPDRTIFLSPPKPYPG